MITEIYVVRNKVFYLLFEDKDDAEKCLGKIATPSNGLHLEDWAVIPRQKEHETPGLVGKEVV